MTLFDRIFATAELKDAPPVLVDVGAAGGVAPIWKQIAKYSIGVGFEPDARDAEKLRNANRAFKQWIYCEGLVAPEVDQSGRKAFYLTRSPHCSSLLKPRNDLLSEWSFADLFVVERVGSVPAVTLPAALSRSGISGVDWLKCDTQGLDLSIFLSLPPEWRHRVLVVDFEPGLIDAYEGEDKFWRTLQVMESEPYWICDLQVGTSVRGEPTTLARVLGGDTVKWVHRLAPPAPAYVNVRYFQRLPPPAVKADRRSLLLAWVFADVLGQPGHGLMVASHGLEHFGGDLFADLQRASRRRLRRAMLRKLPAWLWRRLGLPG